MDTVTSTAVHPRVRLLAVLAADAVGFSRLMSIDDRGTVEALDAARALFRAEIATHAGRVVDMAGDSVLAVFDNATAAVSAALAIQACLAGAQRAEVPADRCLHFRIGVHLGDVIEKADGSVYGDGVNIAARLQGLAQAGGVTVSESVRSTVRGRTGARFEAQGEQRVKNIADPVRAYRVSTGSGLEGADRSGPPAPVAAAAAPVNPTAQVDQPGIAVLPFAHAADIQEQANFADGLADDIIRALAAVPGLMVIARSSTFSYRGRVTDARTVGSDLGVRYVVEGTLRLVAQRMRLHVSLVDCRSNGSLWSERYDVPVEDLFVVQDEITAQIMNAVQITIIKSEARAIRRVTPQGLRAWQLRVQALDHFFRWNREEMPQAIALCRGAIELDPSDAISHAYLATSLWAAAISGWLPDGRGAIDEALRMAERSINLDESLAIGHQVLASVLIGFRRYDEAMAAAERSFQLAPGDFSANSQVGQTFAFAGRYEEALPYLDRAQRLSPRDPMIYWVFQSRSIALFGLQRYEESIAAAQRVSRQLPEWVYAHAMRAAGLAAVGRLDEARAALDEARRLDPALTVRRVVRRLPLRDEQTLARLAGFLTEGGLAAG